MKDKKNIQAIIFDMDGLMVDTEKLYWAVLGEIAAGYGIKEIPEPTRVKMMGRAPLESMGIFGEDLRISASPEDLLRQRDALMEQELFRGVEPMKGLFEIIAQFYGRLQLAVATSSARRIMDIVIDTLGIRNRFAVLQTSDGIRHGKPDPEIFLAAIAKLAVRPEDCVILEDSVNGVLAGVNAGCYVIAVPSEYTRNQDYSRANFIAGDLLEAKAHILTLDLDSNF
jgi:HAD superfamily hydrolase (TIGR01509 family)